MEDFGANGELQRWFNVTSAKERSLRYRVEIGYQVKCTCEYYALKNTPCKHIVYVMMFVLNVPESTYILHQVYLTKNELKCIFENQTDELKKGLKLTTKALLETTWTHKSLSVPDQKLLPLTGKLPMKPNLPEPQNDPYWFIN